MPRFLKWSLNSFTFWDQILHAFSLLYMCYMPFQTQLAWFYRLNETANNAKYNTPISGQSSSLESQRPGFDSRRYQIFWAVGLERGPLSLVSTTEELYGRKSSGSGLENGEYGSRGCRSVGIVRSRTQTTEFFYSTPIKVYQILTVIHNTFTYVIRAMS
jgi:hypothetical protein